MRPLKRTDPITFTEKLVGFGSSGEGRTAPLARKLHDPASLLKRRLLVSSGKTARIDAFDSENPFENGLYRIFSAQATPEYPYKQIL